MDFIKELWAFLRVRKKLWLAPIILVLVVLGGLLVLAQGSVGDALRMTRADGLALYGALVTLFSGLPHLNGHPKDPPTMHHVAYGDAVGGLDGASALLTALWAQRQTGRGQFVDLSQVEGLLPLAAHGFLTQTATGTAWKRQGKPSSDQLY